MRVLKHFAASLCLCCLLTGLNGCDPVNPIFFVSHTADTLYLRATPDTLARVFVQIPHSRRDTTVTPLQIIVRPGDTCLYGYVVGDWFEPEVFERLDMETADGRKAYIEGQKAVFDKITTESYGAGTKYFVNIP